MPAKSAGRSRWHKKSSEDKKSQGTCSGKLTGALGAPATEKKRRRPRKFQGLDSTVLGFRVYGAFVIFADGEKEASVPPFFSPFRNIEGTRSLSAPHYRTVPGETQILDIDLTFCVIEPDVLFPPTGKADRNDLPNLEQPMS